MLLFVLAHSLVAGGLAAVAYLFGRRLTWGFAYDSIWEEAGFSAAIGFGILAYGTLLLGLAGILYRWIALVALGLGVTACYRVWWEPLTRALVRRRAPLRPYLIAVALASILLLSPIWLLAFYPPVAWDSTMYHLAMAKIYVQAHRVLFTPYLRFPAFPQSNEMLFTLSMLLYDDITAQIVELLLLAALVTALVGFGRRFFTLPAGVLSAAILLQSPVVLLLGTTAMADLGLALVTTLAVYAFFIWLDTQETPWLVLVGVLCGLAIGTKYLGLFFLLLILAALIYLTFRRRCRIISPLVFAATAIAVASPWFLRNFYYTRNPVFPFFYGWFGRWFGWGQWRPEYQGVFVNYSGLGMGKGLWPLIKLPWNLSLHPVAFGGGKVSGLCVVLPLAFLALGLLPKRGVVVMMLGLAYTIFWFFTAQEARYLLPALPLLSLACGAGLDAAGARIFHQPRARWIACAPLAIAMLAPGLIWAGSRIKEHGWPPRNQSERDQYLAQRLPAYPALKLMNDRLGSAYTVYAFDMESMAYFADGRFMGDHFGPGRYQLIQDKLNDCEALRQQLRNLGAGYLLIAGKFAGQIQAANKDGCLTLIYQERGVMVFQVSGQHDQ